jgi:PAS domain S-box-containing protein
LSHDEQPDARLIDPGKPAAPPGEPEPGSRIRQARDFSRLLRAVFDQSAVGVAQVETATGRFVRVNRRFAEIVGHPREEIERTGFQSITHPEDVDQDVANMQRLARGESRGFTREKRYRRKDGTDVWVNLTVSPLWRPGETPTYNVTIVQEITARKQAEEASRANEVRYRSLFENMLNGMAYCRMIFDGDRPEDFVYLEVNPAFEALTGLRDVAGRRVSDVIPGIRAADPGLFEIYGRVARTGVPEAFETYLEALKMWFSISVYSPERDHFVAVFDVITERKQTEGALRRSEELFRRTFDLSPVGAVMVRPDFRFIRCNEAFCRFLGYTESELLGRAFMDVTFPDDREVGLAEIRALMAGSLDRARVAKRYLRKDGGVRWGELTMSLIRDPDGGSPFFLSVIQDITDRKAAELERARLEDQVRQGQKMESVGRLAGGVAHDFNNMLQAILGNVDLALQRLAHGSEVTDYLEEIRKSAERSADLTRQLLAFARKQAIQPKVLDLNDTIAGMLKMLQRLLGEDVQLVWAPGAGLWPIRMDPSQIDQILANLSVNARDAMEDGGTLSIETTNVTLDDTYACSHPECVPGDYVMLAMSDTGPGLADDARAHLFEPFFTTKEPGKGTGLGLATVFGIVKQNAGLINAYSESGRGTTFKIYLPRTEREIDAVVAARSERSLRGTETILLVEDEEQILNLGRKILTGQGYAVLVAQTPKLALELSASHPGPLHLLVTDVVMPGMNGRELMTRLQERHPGLRCLYMSGYTANVIAHHGVLDVGVEFLQKPFTIRSLAERVRSLLDAE